MSGAREPLRRVLVAGGGQVGVLTAIALRRALPACEVTVLGLPPDPAAFADQAASALPFTSALHERLGIDEESIVLGAGGSHRLVVHCIGWGGAGQHGMMPYGATIDPALQTGFARNWGAGPRNASGERPAGSLAEVLADTGRFRVSPAGQAGPLAEVAYAMRWSPPAYRELLVRAAQVAGVRHAAGALQAIEPDGDGGIAALAVDGQGRLEADLFVDCSGPRAYLLAALEGHRVIDWSAALPVRSVLLGAPGQPMLALEDRLSLIAEGWLGEFAGREGLQVSLGRAPGCSDKAALLALGVEPLAEIAVAPGRAERSWIGNVVALGDAAARFEPLAFLPLDLAHRQLDLLLELLPGRVIEPFERAEYNRRSGLMMDGVRDVLGAHYAAPAARAVFGESAMSDALAATLDQFARRGRIPFREEAPLLGQETMALLAALGFAQGATPQSRATAARELEAAQRGFAARARTALECTPPYGEWMASLAKGLDPSPAPRG